jgi:chaperonin GroES
MLKIRPLNDKIVIQPLESTNISKGGILLIVTKDNYMKGKVVAVSEGYYIDGKFHKLDVEVGDIVLLQKDVGAAVEIDRKAYRVVREEDIMAIEK